MRDSRLSRHYSIDSKRTELELKQYIEGTNLSKASFKKEYMPIVYDENNMKPLNSSRRILPKR